MISATARSFALIKDLKLEPHPEGGYFTVTDTEVEHKVVNSPYADDAPRNLASSIYYLLSYNNHSGIFHMNKSMTYHVLHQGRAEYTLITPGNPPKIEKKVMGTNLEVGETRMLFVGTGIWKRSTIPEKDMKAATTDEEKDATNCLITEVVVPGFDWHDHEYMRVEDLKELFADQPNGKALIEEFSQFVGE
ncbi:RmlC-like cupin domain-containing protein [Panaeolus papilionaceus]|nr:RmlC-like cupin domain-containing protein [Panaeolus papilionaceus]